MTRKDADKIAREYAELKRIAATWTDDKARQDRMVAAYMARGAR